jgi:hypothetical protein
VTDGRVTELAGFGYTQRQRQFLVTVMVHAGCFLERQYCAFTTAKRMPSRFFAMAPLATLPAEVRVVSVFPEETAGAAERGSSAR